VYTNVSYAQALKYAGSMPNYLGGMGLLYPLKSSVYRGLLRTAGRGALVGLLVTVDVSLGQALWTEIGAFRAGECQ
jgi:hypothetical protein